MSENKKIKFNIIDAIVLVVVIAAIAFVGWHLLGDRNDTSSETVTYTISYFCEEAPDFAAKAIYTNDPVSEDYTDAKLGYVTDVKLSPSITYATDAQGNMHKTSKPDYSAVELTTVLEMPKAAATFEHGVQVDEAKLSVGHSITIRVGKAKIYGRVSGIEIAE